MAEYFFTDPDLLQSQNQDNFGYVDENKYSLTSLHRGSAIPFIDPNDPDNPAAYDQRGPDAFAVVDGSVLAFEITDPPSDSGPLEVIPRYNVVLKPSVNGRHSEGSSVPKVKFFVYRGILSKSLPLSPWSVAHEHQKDIELRKN
jgi:hypothetical protein